MPKNLCSTCSRKLQNAYSFVLQAQETNKKLLHCSTTSVTEFEQGTAVGKYLDCLLESPIDIPSNTVEYMHIKLEPFNTEESLFDSFPLSDEINDNFEEDELEMGAVKMMYNNVDTNVNSNSKPWNIYTKEESLVTESSIHFLGNPKHEEKGMS